MVAATMTNLSVSFRNSNDPFILKMRFQPFAGDSRESRGITRLKIGMRRRLEHRRRYAGRGKAGMIGAVRSAAFSDDVEHQCESPALSRRMDPAFESRPTRISVKREKSLAEHRSPAALREDTRNSLPRARSGCCPLRAHQTFACLSLLLCGCLCPDFGHDRAPASCRLGGVLRTCSRYRLRLRPKAAEPDRPLRGGHRRYRARQRWRGFAIRLPPCGERAATARTEPCSAVPHRRLEARAPFAPQECHPSAPSGRGAGSLSRSSNLNSILRIASASFGLMLARYCRAWAKSSLSKLFRMPASENAYRKNGDRCRTALRSVRFRELRRPAARPDRVRGCGSRRSLRSAAERISGRSERARFRGDRDR